MDPDLPLYPDLAPKIEEFVEENTIERARSPSKIDSNRSVARPACSRWSSVVIAGVGGAVLILMRSAPEVIALYGMLMLAAAALPVWLIASMRARKRRRDPDPTPPAGRHTPPDLQPTAARPGWKLCIRCGALLVLLDVLLLGAILLVAAWWIFAPMRARRLLLYAPIVLVSLRGPAIPAGRLLLAVPARLRPPSSSLALLSLFSRKRARGPPRPARPHRARRHRALLARPLHAPPARAASCQSPPGPTPSARRSCDGSTKTAPNPTPLLDDKRNVIAQAWYPLSEGKAGSGRKCQSWPISTASRPCRIRSSLFPELHDEELRRHRHACRYRRPPASRSAKPLWPVVIFSHGYGATRAVYTGLAAGLASRGYIVITLDHPTRSAVTELADGAIVAEAKTFPYSRHAGRSGTPTWSPGSMPASPTSASPSASSRGLAPSASLPDHLDLTRIRRHRPFVRQRGLRRCSPARSSRDSRRQHRRHALWRHLGDKPLAQPFLLLESDHVEGEHSDKNIADNKTLLANLVGPGWAYEMHRANHYSFTDAPLFFRPALPLRPHPCHGRQPRPGRHPARHARHPRRLPLRQGRPPLRSRTTRTSPAARFTDSQTESRRTFRPGGSLFLRSQAISTSGTSP